MKMRAWTLERTETELFDNTRRWRAREGTMPTWAAPGAHDGHAAGTRRHTVARARGGLAAHSAPTQWVRARNLT